MTDGDTVYASAGPALRRLPALAAEPTRRAREILDQSATGLHAFSTETAGETAYVGSGEVPGYLLNQWSLSEHEGTLRAATTSMPPWNSGARSESAVRTLQERDGRLVQVGASAGSARGERIYAVRYIGDTGFVVTFRQVDPLYTLDLSDPRGAAGGRRAQGPRLLGLPAPARRRAAARRRAGRDRARAGGPACSSRCSTSPTSPSRSGSTSTPSAATPGRPSRSDHHAFLWWAPERLAVIPAVRYDEDYVQHGVRRLARVPRQPRGRDRRGRPARAPGASSASATSATSARWWSAGACCCVSAAGVLSTFTGRARARASSCAYGG